MPPALMMPRLDQVPALTRPLDKVLTTRPAAKLFFTTSRRGRISNPRQLLSIHLELRTQK